MTFKSLRVPTLGLAGVIAMAATAGPAVADDLTLKTFIPLPADSTTFQLACSPWQTFNCRTP